MPPEKPLELIKGFIKFSGYKFNVEKKSVVFLHAKSKLQHQKTWNTFNQGGERPDTGNYKTLMKEIE